MKQIKNRSERKIERTSSHVQLPNFVSVFFVKRYQHNIVG